MYIWHAFFIVVNHGMSYGCGAGSDQVLQVAQEVIAEIRQRCPVVFDG
jgi:hypothetical protein